MATVFTPSQMSQTATSLLSTYASVAGTMMLFRSMATDLIPPQLRSYLVTLFHFFFPTVSSNLALVIEEYGGITRNKVYDAAELYLATKISPKTERLRLSKTPKQKNFTITIEKNEEVTDDFEGIQLKWKYVCVERQNNYDREQKFFELSFNKKSKDKIIESYLPYVLRRANEIKAESKVVKIYNRDCPHVDDGDDDDESEPRFWVRDSNKDLGSESNPESGFEIRNR